MPFAEKPLLDAWVQTREPHEAAFLNQLFLQESNFTPSARSSTGARGLGQITRGTWTDIAEFARSNIAPEELPEGLTYDDIAGADAYDRLASEPFTNAFMTWANIKRLEQFALEGGGAIDGINDKRIRSGQEGTATLLDAVGGDPRQWATVIGAGHKDGMGRMQLFTNETGGFDFTPAREFYRARREFTNRAAQDRRAEADAALAAGNVAEADRLGREARRFATTDSAGHVFGFADRLSTAVGEQAGLPPLQYSPEEVADFIELRAPGHTLDNPAVANFTQQAQTQGLDLENLRDSAAQLVASRPEPDLTGAIASVDPAQPPPDPAGLPPVAGLPPQVVPPGNPLGVDGQAGAAAPTAGAEGEDLRLGQQIGFGAREVVDDLSSSVGAAADRLGQGAVQLGSNIIDGAAQLPGLIRDNAAGIFDSLPPVVQAPLGLIQQGVEQGRENVGNIDQFVADLINPAGQPQRAGVPAPVQNPLDTILIDAGQPFSPLALPLIGDQAPQQIVPLPPPPDPLEVLRAQEAAAFDALTQSQIGTLSPADFNGLSSQLNQARDGQVEVLRQRAAALAANNPLQDFNNDNALSALDAGGVQGTGAELRALTGANQLDVDAPNFGAINQFLTNEDSGRFQSLAGTQVANQFANQDPVTAAQIGRGADIFSDFDTNLAVIQAGLNGDRQAQAAENIFSGLGAEIQGQLNSQRDPNIGLLQQLRAMLGQDFSARVDLAQGN